MSRKRCYYGQLPDDTITVKKKPWTPDMIMAYRNITPHIWRQLRKTYEAWQILQQDFVTQKYAGRRTFVDNSPTYKVHGRDFTLAQIFYFAASAEELKHSAATYRKFSQRVRTEMRRRPETDVNNVISLVAQQMRVYDPILLMKNLTEQRIEKMKENYIDFINTAKLRVEYVEESRKDVNDRWLECARKDPSMAWYLYAVHDELVAELQSHIGHLQRLIDERDREIVALTDKVKLTEAKLQRAETNKRGIIETKDSSWY